MKELTSPYLQRSRLKKHSSAPVQTVKATDILYQKMIDYNTKARAYLQYLIDDMKSDEKAQFDKVKLVWAKMKALDDLVIDCAHKLAPYQTPKLESIEVKSKVEHRHVMRLPSTMKTAEEWMKQTGAEKLTKDETVKEAPKHAHVETVLDYADEDDDDTYQEPGLVH